MDLTGINPLTSAKWPEIKARAVDQWIVACDLGQQNDSTAIAIVHHTVEVLDTFTPNKIAKHWKQDRVTRFDLVHLERFPLGMDYVSQMHRVRELLAREPLASNKPDLIFDASGVGLAVVDIADAIGLQHSRVVITAGLETTQADWRTWHVPKGVLISGLEAKMHTGELRVADAIAEKEQFKAELAEFQRHVTASGRPTFGARGTSHDDIILAVAIACWFATARPWSESRELRI